MAIQGVSGVTPNLASLSQTVSNATSSTNQPSFADFLGKELDKAAGLGQTAENMATSYATGGNVSVASLMISEQQASLAVDMVSQVASRVQESYRTMMNMQV